MKHVTDVFSDTRQHLFSRSSRVINNSDAVRRRLHVDGQPACRPSRLHHHSFLKTEENLQTAPHHHREHQLRRKVENVSGNSLQSCTLQWKQSGCQTRLTSVQISSTYYSRGYRSKKKTQTTRYPRRLLDAALSPKRP